MSIYNYNKFIGRLLSFLIVIYSIFIIFLVLFSEFFLSEGRILFHLFLYSIVFFNLLFLSRNPKAHNFFLLPIWCIFLLIININTHKIYKLSSLNLDNIENVLKTKEVIFARKNMQTIKNEFYKQGKKGSYEFVQNQEYSAFEYNNQDKRFSDGIYLECSIETYYSNTCYFENYTDQIYQIKYLPKESNQYIFYKNQKDFLFSINTNKGNLVLDNTELYKQQQKLHRNSLLFFYVIYIVFFLLAYTNSFLIISNQKK